MKNKANKQSTAGFTVIEILFVLAIWGIILLFTLPALNTARRRAFLDSDTQMIVNTLQRAQSQSLTGKKVAEFAEGTPTPEYNYKYQGFAVHIPIGTPQIYLYEDWTDQTITSAPIDAVDSTRKETVKLEYTKVYEINPTPVTASQGIDIRFDKMTGKIVSSYGFMAYPDANTQGIVLKIEEPTGYKKQVVITAGGLIYSESIN